jgi:hypothetical protein
LTYPVLGNFLSTIVKDWDARFGPVMASFAQHMELVDKEAWVAFLERALPNSPSMEYIL